VGDALVEVRDPSGELHRTSFYAMRVRARQGMGLAQDGRLPESRPRPFDLARGGGVEACLITDVTGSPIPLRLFLLVDAVDASVTAAEVPVRVVHLGDANDVAENLHASGFEFGRGGFDVIDTEAEHDSVVEAVVRKLVGLVQVEDRAVRHGKQGPAILF